MNSILKKIISGITILSMCTAIIGIISASADDVPPEATSTKRPLTIEFMGVGNTPATVGKKSGNLTAENATNKDKFWIGIGVERVNDLPLFTDGVYSLEVAFEYDPAYLRPDAQDGVTEEVKESTWNTDIKNINTGSGNDWDEKYLVESVIETDLDTETDRANKDKLTERANWKMCTVCLTLTESDIANIRFKGLDSADKQYLVKLPFTLISVPNEYATDQNPIVLSLVRGPETFDIGSGNLGETPYAKWNETENQEAANNLKTYFDFQGDIRLFGEEQAITDITPFRNIPQKDEDGNPIKDTDDNILTEEETYELSQDENLNGGEFNPEIDTYYLSISNQPNNLQLRIQSSELPTVTVNGTEVNVTLVDGNYVTDAFELNELDKTVNNGFNNTVTVQAGGGTKYTIYVQRLLQPKIVLNYGNSPYGEIMSKYPPEEDETILNNAENRENELKSFKDTHIFSDITPNLTYYTNAWASYTGTGEDGSDYNGDEDPTAIFIFQRTNFKDVGFKAYDAMGNSVPDSEVSLSLTMTSFKGGFVHYDNTDNPSDVVETGSGSGYIFTTFKNYDIRPDVYEIIYQFTDSNSEDIVTAKRKAISISDRGDVVIDGNKAVNNIDATNIISNNAYFLQKDVNSLYKFRIADVVTDANKAINNIDATEIISKATKGLPQFYNRLPSS